VENASLAAVPPPDINYNLAMPADVIQKGKLSDLQLEAVVYGCMRHLRFLPAAATPDGEEEDMMQDQEGRDGRGEDGGKKAARADAAKSKAEGAEADCAAAPEVGPRAGFLLGDGAGMGKGRTLAGYVLENVCRGRMKHVWVSVSSDLYEDAKRDLSDIGLEKFAKERTLILGRGKASSYDDLHRAFGANHRASRKEDGQGLLFTTYHTLIGKMGRGKKGNDESTAGEASKTRLDQIIDWCGGEDFDGLLMFDECHKVSQLLLFFFVSLGFVLGSG
jgi:hypothetical protein